MPDNKVRLLTMQEVMDVFGISRSTVDRWRRSKQLPSIKIGKEVYIDPDELQKWIIRYRNERNQTLDREPPILRLAIGYQSGTAHMWSSLLMKETGFLKEELKRFFPNHALEIEWHNGGNGLELLEGLIQDKIQIASLGDYPIHISGKLSRLLPSFRPVLLAFDGKTARGKGISIVVPSDSRVRHPDDLLRSAICTVPHSSTSPRVQDLLFRLGCPDAQIIPTGMNESMERIMRGTIGASAMWEPYVSMLAASGSGKILFEEGIGEDYLTGVIANAHWAEQNTGTVIAYLKAHLHVHHFIRTQKDKAVNIITRSTGIPETVAWKVLSGVRWDSAIYAKDLETLRKLEPAAARSIVPETSEICVRTDYLQLAVEELGMPSLCGTPLSGEWSNEQMY